MNRVVFLLSLLLSACSLRPSLPMDQTEALLLASPPDSVVCALKNLSVKNVSDSLARSVYTYYDRYGNRRQRMISSYYLAAVEVEYNNLAEAVLLFKKAETIATDIKDYGFLGMSRQILGGLYSANYLSEESFNYYKGAVSSFNLLGDAVSADINKIYIAEYYCEQMLFPEALSIVDSLLVRSGDDNVIQSALRVKGDVCFAQGKLRDADSLFSMCREKNTRILVKKCLVKEKMGHSLEADSLLRAAVEACGTAADSAIYFSAARNLYSLRSDYEREAKIMEASLANQRRVMSSILERSVAHAQGAYWKDYNFVRRLYGHNASLYVVIILLVLVVSNLLCFWIMQKRRIALISDKEMIATLKEDIIRFQEGQQVSEGIVNTLLQEQIDRIQKLSSSFFKWTDEAILLRENKYGKMMNEELISDFRKELRSLRDNPRLVSGTERALDQACGHIMQSLRQAVLRTQSIELNERDFELITLFYAGFSSRSISFLMDMTVEAVRKRKSRYKKLFSEQGDSFNPFLKALK